MPKRMETPLFLAENTPGKLPAQLLIKIGLQRLQRKTTACLPYPVPAFLKAIRSGSERYRGGTSPVISLVHPGPLFERRIREIWTQRYRSHKAVSCNRRSLGSAANVHIATDLYARPGS